MIKPVLDFLGNPIRAVTEKFFRGMNEVFYRVNHHLDEADDLFNYVLHAAGLSQALIKFRDLVSALGNKLDQIAGIRGNIAENLFDDLPYPADYLPNNIKAVRHTCNDTANLVHLLFVFRESLYSVGQFTEASGHIEQLLAGLGREHFLKFSADSVDDVLDGVHNVPEALDQLIPAAKILPALHDFISRGGGFIDDLSEEIAHAGQQCFCFLEVTDDVLPGLRPTALRRFFERIKELCEGFHFGGCVGRILCQLKDLVSFFCRIALCEQLAFFHFHGLEHALFHIGRRVAHLFGDLLKVP